MLYQTGFGPTALPTDVLQLTFANKIRTDTDEIVRHRPNPFFSSTPTRQRNSFVDSVLQRRRWGPCRPQGRREWVRDAARPGEQHRVGPASQLR